MSDDPKPPPLEPTRAWCIAAIWLGVGIAGLGGVKEAAGVAFWAMVATMVLLGQC